MLELADLGRELPFAGLEPLLELGDVPLGLLQLAETELGLSFQLGLADIERVLALVEPAYPLGSFLVRRLDTLFEPFHPAPLGLEQLLELVDAGLTLGEVGGPLLDRLHETLDAPLELIVLRLVGR